MNNPLISVILPTYNGEKFIDFTIKSILNQTYENLELIIVNDCSTDNTESIISHYSQTDSRIKLVTNKINQKLPGSLNIGFNHSLGKYITWISDDNYFSPDAIQTLYSGLSKSKTDIIYSSYYFIDKFGNKLDVFRSIPEEILFKCSPGACFLYSRKVHEELNGFETHKFRMEDYDFWLRSVAHGFNYTFIDNPELYYYRKHEGSLTTEIHRNEDTKAKYRQDHFDSFKYFFSTLFPHISDDFILTHLEIYFNDIETKEKTSFLSSEKLIVFIEHLEILKSIAWESYGFDKTQMNLIIDLKRNEIISLIVNNLVFQNIHLSNKNPKIAKELNKPISWYYGEYEVLPMWYKKFGHIIKFLMGNKKFGR